MGKCLVTKLNGTVNNNDLLHIGECVIGVESSSANELLFQADLGSTEYYCEQSHVLGEENVNAGVKRAIVSWKDIKSSAVGLYRFHFLNKYSIRGLLEKSIKGINEINQVNYLNNITQLVLSINSADVFDLNTLKQSTSLNLLILKGNVAGDISSLKNMIALTNLSINSSHVTGDISSLKNMTALTNFSGTLFIKGKAEELKMLSSLTSFNCANAVNKGDFGDIATLPASFIYLYIGSDASISWTSRPATSKIIGIFGSPKLSNIDKMLQDQAQCVTGITSSTAEFMKSITATGTRTSASDAAVQTLQSKGYTVSITPA
jgi:hypothetical protein